MEDSMNYYRTHFCGDITEDLINKNAKVAGWIENIRDHGGVKFLDLRDQYGIVQIVVHDEAMISGIPKESVVSVSGKVVKRAEDTINPKIKTGLVEILADSLDLLSKSTPNLPFEIQTSTDTKEELRLKYRYLDLRRDVYWSHKTKEGFYKY